MLASSLSIYRGYTSHGGMGEQPSDARGKMHGEQYLYADDELWNTPGLTNQVRIWMTLYDDQRIAGISYKLGANIEGWSYFDCGNLRFVTRLISGGEFGPRLAYFSHCRAWHVEAFQEGDDPGAFLGQSKAFADQWKEGQESGNSVPQPSMKMWRQVVGSNTDAAIRLVAQLYRAVVTGCPVVIGAPHGEFVIGSRMHQLVSFARAALPIKLKKNCRIRIFTGRPEVFLVELKANLVAVPEEMASHALTGRPDAALLDMDCKRRAGPEADQEYLSYAKGVVDRALSLEDYPTSLFVFTGRVEFPPDRMPSKAEVASVPMTYHLVADPGNQRLMDGLLDHFRKEAAKPGIPLNWKAIIHTEDWQQFSQAKLTDFALSLAESPAIGMLIQGAREELARRRVSLDREATKWLASVPKEVRSEENLALFRLKLISRLTSSAEDLSLNELSELLNNNELAGEVLSRGEIAAETAAAASKRADDIRRLILLAKNREDCRRNADKVIRMLADGSDIPAGLTESHLLMLDPPDSNAELENYLNWAEVLDRVKSARGKKRIEELKTHLLEIAARICLFNFLGTNHWKVLEQFALPKAWDNDLRDQLLRSDQQLRKIGTLRMLGLLDAQQKMPVNVVALLDEGMRSNPKGTEDTTKCLVETRYWLAWRLAPRTTLIPEVPLHQCATVWLSTRNHNPYLEEWKQVIQDLGQLSAKDIDAVHSQAQDRKPPWPEIPLYEEEQIADLVDKCPKDLGIAAELAEAIDPENPHYHIVLGYFRSIHDIPSVISAQALQCLVPAVSNNSTLGLAEASSLVASTTHRRSEAQTVLCSAVFHSLRQKTDEVEEVEKAATDAGLWNLPSFPKRFANWLAKGLLKVNEPQDLKALEMLERHVQDSWPPVEKPSRDVEKQAQSYANKGLMRLAGILGLDLYKKLVYALIRGSDSDASWNKMLDAIENCKAANVREHPFMLLSGKIEELTPEQQIGLDQNGWGTFKQVLAKQPSFSVPLGPSGVRPILSLAASLQNSRGLGEVASELLRFKDINRHFADANWWKIFFESMECCQRRPGMARVTDRLDVALAVVARTMRELPEIPYKGLEELKKRIQKFPGRTFANEMR